MRTGGSPVLKNTEIVAMERYDRKETKPSGRAKGFTMNCQEIHKFVHVYVDGEFGDRERREFEKHLQGCEECCAVVRFEERFKSTLQKSMPKIKAPKSVVDKLRTHLDAEPEPASPWSTWLYVAVPAAAMAAAAILVFILWPTHESGSSEVLEAGVAHHSNSFPMEVQGPDVQTVASWYEDKVRIPVRPPRLNSHGVDLAGGRLVNFNRSPAAYLVYSNGNRKKVSVHIFDPRHIPRRGLVRNRISGKSVYIGSVNGHKVAVFKHNGVGYAVTADVSNEHLKRIVRTIIRRH